MSQPIRHSDEPPGAGLSAAVASASRSADLVARLVEKSVAQATRKAYASDWHGFASWCALHGLDPLAADPPTVAGYIAEAAAVVDERGRPAVAPTTLKRWVAGINQMHAAAGRTDVPGRSELVRRTMAGIRRTRATPPRRRRPLHLDELATVDTAALEQATAWPEQVRAHRDTLILTWGHLGAFRGAELVRVLEGDVELVPDGATVLVRQSKTDQDAEGLSKALRRTTSPVVCPLCAWRHWRHILDAYTAAARRGVIAALLAPLRPDAYGHVCSADVGPSPTPDLPVVRWLGRFGWPSHRPVGANVIRHVVLSRARHAGLPAAVIDQLGGHSLRAGFVTDAYSAGASDDEVMRQTWHRSVAQVRTYQRDAPHVGNAVTRLDLP